jgi:hydrogenase maturation protease
MNLATVNQIAKAVLYEGYMLYPYRPSSVKNQQRWNFGVLCPQSYSEAQNGTEAWTMQTECLLEADSKCDQKFDSKPDHKPDAEPDSKFDSTPNATPTLEVRVRFLQLVARSIGQLTKPVIELRPNETPDFRPVDKLTIDGRVYRPWQEAVEREVILPLSNLDALVDAPLSQSFLFPASRELEYLKDAHGLITAVIIRDQSELRGMIETRCDRVAAGLFKVSVRIRNRTPFADAHHANREDALLNSLVSTHTVLGVHDGKFVSLFAPPDHLANLVAECKNVGAWPVLVGEEGQYDTLLSSPIILYDYPRIAPESAGDLFDGTEIDEILSLRIMTLTDEEKREMSQSDERARQMLERTESMPVEQFMKLHGVLRGLRPVDSSSTQEETQ